MNFQFQDVQAFLALSRPTPPLLRPKSTIKLGGSVKRGFPDTLEGYVLYLLSQLVPPRIARHPRCVASEQQIQDWMDLASMEHFPLHTNQRRRMELWVNRARYMALRDACFSLRAHPDEMREFHEPGLLEIIDQPAEDWEGHRAFEYVETRLVDALWYLRSFHVVTRIVEPGFVEARYLYKGIYTAHEGDSQQYEEERAPNKVPLVIEKVGYDIGFARQLQYL